MRNARIPGELSESLCTDIALRSPWKQCYQSQQSPHSPSVAGEIVVSLEPLAGGKELVLFSCLGQFTCIYLSSNNKNRQLILLFISILSRHAHTCTHTSTTQSDRQRHRQAGRQIDRQTDRDKPTDRHTHTHTPEFCTTHVATIPITARSKTKSLDHNLRYFCLMLAMKILLLWMRKMMLMLISDDYYHYPPKTQVRLPTWRGT